MKAKRILAFLLTVIMIGGMLPAVSLAAEDDLSFNFTLSAYSQSTAASSINISTITQTSHINSAVSEPWYYVNMKNIPGNGMYADGFQYYARKDILDNNFLVLYAGISTAGTYQTQLNFTKAGYTGTVNIHMVPKAYADGKWRMTSDALDISEVISDSSVTKLISVDTHSNSSAASPATGSTVALESGDYYLIFTNEMGAKDTSDGRYYGHLQSLDFVRTYPLTDIEASFGAVRVGDELSPSVTWKSGDIVLDGTGGTVSMEILENSEDALISSAAGKIFAVAEGSAKVKVTGSFGGDAKSVDVDITVLPAEPLSGVDAEYFFHNNAYQDFNTGGLVIAGAKGGHLVTEAEFNTYAMRDYGTDRPWGLVSAHITRPDSKGTYLGSSGDYTDMSGEAGDWVAYKIKVTAPGKYNVDVSGLNYGNGGRAEIYMVPYTSDMTFSSIAANVDTYMAETNLVADADLNGTSGKVGRVAFAGKFVASDALDYSAGYAEYLMVIKQCYSRINPNARYVLIKGIHLSGNLRSVDITTYLSEDTIGVGESVTVASVEGTYEDGSKSDLSDAELIFSVAEDDKDIISFDEATGEITALAEGVGTLKTCAIANGTVSYTETELTVDNNYGILKAYLYTDKNVALGDALTFSSAFELNNRKVITGGTVESVEIVSQSEDGVLTKNGSTIRATKGGTATLQAKINARGTIVDSDIVTVNVISEEMANTSVLTIDLNQGAYTGDSYTLLDEIKTYTDYRRWVFVGTNNLDPTYPTISLATSKLRYAQMVFLKGENLYNSYFAFKVDFPKDSVYRADVMMGLLRYRSALLDLYIMPATAENEADILGKTTRDGGYYVGSADFWSSPDTSKVEKSFGTAEIPKGEQLVVFRIGEGGTAGAGGDCAYPLYFTFTDEEAFDSAELSLPEGKTVLGIDETAQTAISLLTLKGEKIEYNPEDITEVVYKSDNASVAAVDKNGVITAKSEGVASITAEVTYDGVTKTAALAVSVSDDSGIVPGGITVSSPASVYVYGGINLKLSATMNSGKTLEIPAEYVTWEILEEAPAGAAELTDDYVSGKAVGSVVLRASVSSDYKNGAADGIVIDPFTLNVTWDATVDPQIYTLKERENAIKNASRYSWARDEVKAARTEADKYVDKADSLYNLIVPEGLPRWYHVGHVGDPVKFFCRYCGVNIGQEYGSYGWGVDALSRSWKIQCPDCKRQFPSNDFGSFYKLGLTDSGSWSYERALQEHHEMLFHPDGVCSCEDAPHPTNDRMSDAWKEYYGFGKGYLANELYEEMDEKLGVVGWGVDDSLGYMQPYISAEKAAEIAGPGGDINKVPGYNALYYDGGDGLAWYADGARKGPVQHTYIAYYLHEGLWYGHSTVATSGVIRKAINSLADAFVYTGEEKYGRAGAILLDKIADFYPDFDWFTWHTWRGDSYYGTIVDPVWSTDLATEFAGAYDAFLPIYNDPYVIEYLSTHAPRYETDEVGDWKRDDDGNLTPVNLKDTPGGARKNIEDNLLLEIFEATKYGKNWGNFGMHQGSVATAAVALNRLPESKEMIDWIMAPGPKSGTSGISTGTSPRVDPVSGGMFIGSLMEEVDRDGSGSENAPGYNSLWPQNFLTVAELIKDFKLYPGANLYENPKFTKMFSAQIRLTLGGYYTTQTGDSGAIASTGYAVYAEDILKCYQATRDPLLAQTLWLMKETYGNDLRGSIFDDDPEQLTEDIEAVIEEIGELNLGSDMLTGYGFAALRAGSEYDSASVSSYSNTNRDVALYFGANHMHGHLDTLNLFMDAFGLNIAPDLGYPEVTGTQPHRYEWVRTTISHNTVVVDEKEQGSRSYTQTPHHFDDAGRVKLMDISADVYDNTDDYRRTVMMVEVDDENAYSVDFFHVKGGRDHMYSFHSQSDELTAVSGLSDLEVTPMYSDSEGNLYGVYAGKDVKYGADPGGVFSATYPRGYTWLKNVRTYNSVENDFSVEFNVKDWKKVLNEKRDIRLRLTMVSDDPMEEVTFASAAPQQTKSNAHAGDLDYLLVRNKGTNLDTTFTTVLEPYDAANKYITSIEKAPMVRELDSKPGVNDAYSAVKVTLENGRVDYIIYSTNNEVDYVIDDKISFRGFAGVISLENADGKEEVVYSYLNDGEVLALVDDTEAEESIAAYTGVVSFFTRDLAFENFITYTPAAGESVDVSLLPGKFVYVDNDGVQNGAYKIFDAREVDGKIELSIGDVSIIRKFVNVNDESLGYVYNIAEGQTLRIPLTSTADSSPTISPVADATTSVGSTVTIPIDVTSDSGKELTLIGTSLPRGMTINQDTMTLTWKPDKSQGGEHHVAVTASDGTLETTVHFTVTVYGATTGSTSGQGNTDGSDDENTNTPSVGDASSSLGEGATGGGSGTGTSSGGGGGGGGGSSGQGSTSGEGTADGSDTGTNTGDQTDDGTTAPDGGTASGNVRFIDLGNHAWAEDAINSLADDGIIKGTTANTYSPANNITRADYAILLVRAFNLTSDDTTNFADVNASDYFASELAIARNTGIVNGIGDNKYAPRNTVTRQDMMVIIYRALEKLGAIDTTNPVGLASADYPDYADVAEYAKEAVDYLVSNGLVNGKNGRIAPTDYTTRAEVAVLLKRILDNIK